MVFSKKKSAKRGSAASARSAKSRKTKKGLIARMNLSRKEGQLLVFVLVFAVLGGSYYVYKSSAYSFNTHLHIKVVGYSGTVNLVSRSPASVYGAYHGQTPHYNRRHTVGLCKNGESGEALYTFGVKGSRTCSGYKIGPFVLVAPNISGYTASWSGCDGGFVNNNCNVNYLEGRSDTITLTYKQKTTSGSGKSGPAATCSILASPAALKFNQQVNLSLTITNTGGTRFAPEWTWTQTSYAGSRVNSTGTLNKSGPALNPNQSVRSDQKGWKNSGNRAITRVVYTAKSRGSSPAFSCSKQVNLVY